MISLRHAVVVAEVLNFHHAANVLGTTQSSVSARIKGLEDALGVLLFERRHRGVRLTEAGRHFVAEVSAGIAQLDHAVRTAGAMLDGTEWHLAIGLHSSTNRSDPPSILEFPDPLVSQPSRNAGLRTRSRSTSADS
ncbi:LysR family transcriptional regulator [Rhizobium sp. NZLR1b]|nr:LysR family transcriptional regulator [Rhizobium sp. NZLR1b]MBX5192571.1 LysR family transcriptional regulator [Rhizobium sp. NZLR3b]